MSTLWNRPFLVGARLLLAAALVQVGPLAANHYSGAHISYTCLSGNFYTVNMDLYLDCSGVAVISQDLYFSNQCGVFFEQLGVPLTLTEEVSPLCASQIPNSTCQGGTLPGFRRYRYSTTVYLSPCNYWTVGWSVCCRNSTQNLLNTPGIYAEATLNNFGGVCDNSPRFADNGVPYLCVNEPVAYNPGASDPNGNQMVFQLISGRLSAVNPVTYRAGFTGSQPIPGIIINAQTGQLNFNPSLTGNYVVVIKISTYNSSGQLIGTVMRDLMFVVLACDESPPIPATAMSITGSFVGTGVSSVAVCQGQSFCANLVIADEDPSSIISVATNAATLLPGSTFTVIGTNPVTARICWTANLAVLPANVFLDITDGACPIANSASRAFYVNSCLLLPVELVSFTAQQQADGVLTEWATASEQDADHFVVERSTDAFLFHEVGRVQAVGNSPVLNRYTFKDPSPEPGLSYYRLRQMDVDGSFDFSEMVAVEFGPRFDLEATFIGSGDWVVSGVPENAIWYLRDALGRHVQIAPAASGIIRFHAGPADNGLLFLTVVSGEDLRTLKLPSAASPGDVFVAKDQ